VRVLSPEIHIVLDEEEDRVQNLTETPISGMQEVCGIDNDYYELWTDPSSEGYPNSELVDTTFSLSELTQLSPLGSLLQSNLLFHEQHRVSKLLTSESLTTRARAAYLHCFTSIQTS
jgi:hypothetical protein